MIAIPKVGETVRVTVRNHNFGFVGWRPKTEDHAGIIVPKFSWTPADEFCMTTSLVRFPIRTIRIANVEKIVKTNGGEVTLATVAAPQPEKQEWIVDGSKGDKYVVSRNGNVFGCTCVAGGFGRPCKHIGAVKAKLMKV